MKPDLDVKQVLWEILDVGLVEKSLPRALELADSLLAAENALSQRIEQQLLSFVSTSQSSLLWALAQTLAENYDFEGDRQAQLVALLFTIGKKIGVKHAVLLLDRNVLARNACRSSTQELIDVLWLLEEDAPHSSIQPEDDSLLAEALQGVAKEAWPNLVG